ncbi:MAG: hypothetical protein ACXU95_17875, partial [Isosphaeraceae bacterium]
KPQYSTCYYTGEPQQNLNDVVAEDRQRCTVGSHVTPPVNSYPSALSQHTEFTTELPESRERLWNLLSF